MEFERFSLSMRERVEELRRTAGHEASSHAFSSLYLWSEEKGYTVCFARDAFVVKGEGFYFFPCGKREDVSLLLQALWREEKTLSFRYAREADLALAKAVFGEKLTVDFDETAREYLFDRTEQIAMSGKKFTYQRAKCNKARRLGEIVSIPLTAANADIAKDITERWASGRPTRGDADVTLRALDCIAALGLFGNLLYLDKEPIGFDLGAMIAPHILDIHIAKTLRDDVDTLMKLLWYETLPETVTVINREEDLGIRGLRMHKSDAQPSGYNDTYTLTVTA
ncbi:MAG: DUF2156 domain-containing protein [Clostridia bacterium]|nr:DUF2156 domain-containing protein [Clostridia bacterium]